MKRLVIFAIIFFSASVQAKNLSAYFACSSFDIPGGSPYVETYLKVIGNSVTFIPSEGTLKGQIEVQWILRSGDKIIHFDKYNLNSPAIGINDSIIPDFVDLQRINLEMGVYQIELTIRDRNTDSKEIKLKEVINMGFPVADTISISDIELVTTYEKSKEAGKFTKSGLDVIPSINNFYPKEIETIKFYAEIYRSDVSPAEDYLLRYYISKKESREILDNYTVSLKQPPKPTNVILGEFSIIDLVSGNYNLGIEIRNKRNQVLAFKQVFFQRSNERNKPIVSAEISNIDITNTFVSPILNKDTLVDYIACLYPISNSREVEFAETQMKMKNTLSMQQYIYYFWSKRDPNDPEAAWATYKKEVEKANEMFTSRIKKGYDTERGRVYLQYGAPNSVADGDDPSAYPYEIWHYYKLNDQTNRKFVFYSTDRSSNEYRLLHSDATGEPHEQAWELKLHERTQQFGIDLDREKSIDGYGSHTKEDFVNPH